VNSKGDLFFFRIISVIIGIIVLLIAIGFEGATQTILEVVGLLWMVIAIGSSFFDKRH
jgi:hypothetical protein